ncbi:unnamed protein product [Adineta ricciae]|uniref:TH1 domain-containing protein n=1 Tax=Adineta ricciae TaxID=249248 RepID=A0A814NU99_ADIRI|nr:unnamed protein product [Adineta ricciae]
MEMDTLPTVRSDFQSLHNMWKTKVQEEQNLSKPKPGTVRRPPSIIEKESAPQVILQSLPSMDDIFNSKQTVVTPEQLNPINENFVEESTIFDDSEQLPPPPASIVMKDQIQSMITLKQCVAKMFDFNTKTSPFSHGKSTGIHHWHITRHVVRSGLIFARSRRASDSIIPILIRTHIAQQRPRSDSLDSIYMTTPLESLVDYFASDSKISTQKPKAQKKIFIKRTISDSTGCIERNRLNETISQYETLMRHLKNYDKFMSTYPTSTSVPLEHSFTDLEKRISRVEVDLQQDSTRKSSMQSRQTQSLARNAGRTFTDFVMNDLRLPPSAGKSLSNEPQRLNTVHAASQTDLTEMVQKVDSTVDASVVDETKEILQQLDNVLINTEDKKEVPITANGEINVIVVNSPVVNEPKLQKKETPLMQRLFEGKKSIYTPENLEMETMRLTDELKTTFELAKKKCFFPSETILFLKSIVAQYVTKMTKIDRRGYKQHVRILCITNERLYNITKKDPYPKEAVLFADILGIGMTPRKDGLVCIHTRETREDRGDWLFLLDYPCEFVVQLFMAMKRTNNDDHLLKIRPKFQHTRRSLATISDDCIIESRPSDVFRIAFENYEILAIYSP